MIRIVFHIIFLQAFLNSFGQSDTLNDGPYVFYKGDSMIIESIINGTRKTEAIDLKYNKAPFLSVPMPNNAGTFFQVALKRSLNPEPSEFRAVEKLLVLSDIEGTFQGFQKLLLAGGVIDGQLNWSFGEGHLIICGDVFDRGADVTTCLWLLYKLENEAKSKGGYVHYILGNHEIMNLSEDIRYVHKKYLNSATLLNKTYMDFYMTDSELGRWLRTKNIMERIGDNLFLHAGVSQTVNELDLPLKRINRSVQPYYDKYGFDSLLLKAKVEPLFNGNTGPFWYRGYFMPPLATEAQVDSTLRQFNAKHIIVGHTLVDSIKTLYGGKVIAIDVNYHEGNYQALMIENGRFYRITGEGEKRTLK